MHCSLQLAAGLHELYCCLPGSTALLHEQVLAYAIVVAGCIWWQYAGNMVAIPKATLMLSLALVPQPEAARLTDRPVGICCLLLGHAQVHSPLLPPPQEAMLTVGRSSDSNTTELLH